MDGILEKTTNSDVGVGQTCTDEEVMNELKDMGYELFDENGDEIWTELAVNEGFDWDDGKDYWTRS